MKEKTMTKIKTSTEYIQIVSRFISREETRYYLCGIHFQPHPKGGLVIVATDGHRLGAIYDKDGIFEGDPVTIPFGKDFLKSLEHRRATHYVWSENISRAKAHSEKIKEKFFAIDEPTLSMEYAKAIDGTFPDWQRVIPKKVVKTDYFNFNPIYLADFKSTDSKFSAVRIYGGEKMEPHLVRIAGIPEFLGILMPMNIHNDKEFSNPMPDFVEGLFSKKDAA